MFWSLFVLLWLCCLVTYFLIKIIPRYSKYRALQVIPGPNGCGFWVGKFPIIFKEPFMGPHKIWWKDIVGYDAPLLRYSKFLGDNMIMVLDPKIIREILTSPVSKKADECRFYKPYTSGPLVFILGRGLVTLEGEEWMQHRRLIQPAFSVSFLKQAIEECVPNKVATFLQYWIDAGEDVEIDVCIHLSALTLDVIGDAGFSYDCNGIADIATWAEKSAKMQMQQQKHEATKDEVKDESKVAVVSPELTDPLIASMNALLRPDLLRIGLYLFGLGKLDQIVNSKTIRVKNALNTTIDGIITNAKTEEQSRDGSSSSCKQATTTKSLLQLLLSAKDPDVAVKDSKKPALADLELRDEVKTFIFAGHETTSTWCMWAMFALAKFPDVQEKLYQDVMKHAPNDRSTNISLDQAESMEYLAAFLQEVLRLYSPVGMTTRKNRYQETLAGYTIPPNTTLCIPVHLMHRHPKHWENAETFSPERWLKSTVTGMDTRGFTFLSFGAGGHNCIGYRFATFEAKLIMAHMVRALRVEIAPSQRDVEHTFTTTITMKAKPGLKVVVKPRQEVMMK